MLGGRALWDSIRSIISHCSFHWILSEEFATVLNLKTWKMMMLGIMQLHMLLSDTVYRMLGFISDRWCNEQAETSRKPKIPDEITSQHNSHCCEFVEWCRENASHISDISINGLMNLAC